MTGENEGEACNHNKSKGEKMKKVKRSRKNSQKTIVSSSYMIIIIIIQHVLFPTINNNCKF